MIKTVFKLTKIYSAEALSKIYYIKDVIFYDKPIRG